ncbi:hypothetical protein L6R52_36140 [Myxococcota bacterium]|nr:hypothetical protein [Myxococcota bacterium]
MAHNPFETPSTEPSAQDFRVTHGTGRFDLGVCFREAWSATWDSFPLWLVAGFVYVIVAVAATVTIVGLFLVVPVLFWGAVLFALNMLDGRPKGGDLFAGFSRYGDSLVSMLLLFLAFFVLSLPGAIPVWVGMFAGSTSLMALGQVASYAWSFVFVVRFAFAPMYIVDQGMPVMDALKASWTATSSQWFMTFVLALVSTIVSFVGLIALVIGFIPSTVIASMMYVSAYRQIAGRTP